MSISCGKYFWQHLELSHVDRNAECALDEIEWEEHKVSPAYLSIYLSIFPTVSFNFE